MSCEMRISGSQSSFHISPKLYSPTTSSSGFESSSRISFNLTRKPNISTKTSSGSSYRSTTRTKSATINSLYATAPTKNSLYELLGIPESVSQSEIKKAYKQLARKYHPDVCPADRTEECTQTFIRVQEAYETLSDPQTRAMYDSDLSKGLHLTFSARKRGQGSERENGEWKSRWQSQINELKRKSTNMNARGSWGARIRRRSGQRNDGCE